MKQKTSRRSGDQPAGFIKYKRMLAVQYPLFLKMCLSRTPGYAAWNHKGSARSGAIIRSLR